MALTRLRTHLTTLAALGATAALVGGLAGSAAAAVDPTRIDPGRLSRGADPTVAHLEGTTLVDGALSVDIDAARVDLLGASGSDHLVAAHDDQGRGPVLRVSPSGATTPVLTPARNGDLVVLAADGSRLAQSRFRPGSRTSQITVWSSSDGRVLARRSFDGFASVLDLDRRRVVVGSTTTTRIWQTGKAGAQAGSPQGRVTLLLARGGYRADLGADRLATFTRDPYDGGCTVVSRLSAPEKRLWRSCAERVETFSPGGRRMATVDLLSDGIGPGQVLVRSAVGKAKGVYRVRGYVGLLAWESPRTLLLETYGRAQGALVRCTGPSCERAGDLVPTPEYLEPARTGLPAAFGVG